MAELALLATMLLVCGGLGLPFVELLPASQFAWRLLLAPTFGVAVLAIGTPVAYECGATIPQVGIGAFVVAVAVVAWRARRLVRAARALAADERRLAIWVGGGWLTVLVLMLLPHWIGGDQFSVFQGNQWDTYGYLDSALVYARKPYAIVHATTSAQILRTPMLGVAQQQLTERPSVHLLYALFSRVAPGQAYRLYYPFLACLLSQFALVAAWAVRRVLPNASPAAWLAIAAVFPLGFWGQYVFDINAWSQIASASGLLVVVVLVLHLGLAPTPAPAAAWLRPALGLGGALALAVGGSVYLYPEGFIIYAATLTPLAIGIPIVRMIRARAVTVRVFVPMLGALVGLATALLYAPLSHHISNQLVHSSTVKVPWWQFFQMFFQGRDGRWNHGFARVSDFASVLFGLYFATPTKTAGVLLAAVVRYLTVAAIVGLLAAVVALAWSRIRIRDARVVSADSRAFVVAWAAASLILLAPAIYLAHDANYWPAGKVVSYAAPVFMTLLAMPIAVGFAHRAVRPLRWIAIAFVVFQIGNGVLRVVAVACAPNGIEYAWPYPEIEIRELKTDLGWDLRGLEPYVTAGTKVLVHPTEPWSEHELMAFAYARGATVAKMTPVTIDGHDIPSPAPGWTPDVEITVDGHAFMLRFPDGRPPLRVVSGEDVR